MKEVNRRKKSPSPVRPPSNNRPLKGIRGKEGFKDEVKESLGMSRSPGATGSSTPGSQQVCSPRDDPGAAAAAKAAVAAKAAAAVKADAAACAATAEASVCSQRKRERMKRLAVMGLVALLALLLLWWLFGKSIWRLLGYPDGTGKGGNANVDGNEYGEGGNANVDGNEYGEGGNGNGDGNAKAGRGRRKTGQVCWFNLPCQYDYEEDEWRPGDASERFNRLHQN